MTVETGAAGAATTEPGATPESGVQPGAEGQQTSNGTGASATDFETAIAGLPADNREWLSKQGYQFTPEGATKIAQQLYAQEKLLGNAIRMPGKDATPEQKAEFLNKLGRPEKADGYELAVPKDLPETLPYDGGRAGEFKTVAHELGLTKQQAAGLHDWFVGKTVADHASMSEAEAGRLDARAAAETDKLVKLWGPLNGETAQANLQYANRVLEDVGGSEVLDELKALKLIGPDRSVLSAPLAQMFSKIGMALYKEDDVLKGDPSKVGNPFADGPSYNETAQHAAVRADKETARSMIVAAGKKPADFGL